MSELLGIPVPSAEQIIVGAELIIILQPVRWFAQGLNNEFRRERNRIIHRHVKAGHKGRLKHCLDAECAKIQNRLRERQEPATAQPEVALDLEP